MGQARGLFFEAENDFIGEDLPDRRRYDLAGVKFDFFVSGYGNLIRSADNGAGKLVNIVFVSDERIEG
jgi:hypothetical protein